MTNYQQGDVLTVLPADYQDLSVPVGTVPSQYVDIVDCPFTRAVRRLDPGANVSHGGMIRVGDPIFGAIPDVLGELERCRLEFINGAGAAFVPTV